MLQVGARLEADQVIQLAGAVRRYIPDVVPGAGAAAAREEQQAAHLVHIICCCDFETDPNSIWKGGCR